MQVLTAGRFIVGFKILCTGANCVLWVLYLKPKPFRLLLSNISANHLRLI